MSECDKDADVGEFELHEHLHLHDFKHDVHHDGYTKVCDCGAVMLGRWKMVQLFEVLSIRTATADDWNKLPKKVLEKVKTFYSMRLS